MAKKKTTPKPDLTIFDLLKRLVNWFLGKAPTKLETLAEETIEGPGVTLVRYQRKTVRAYRTWRAIYKAQQYDIIFGWDTLAYLPDVPLIKKQNRLSTHICHIYRQGLHAKFNAVRGIHEPDIEVFVREEVCLEAAYMDSVLQNWRIKSYQSSRPINTRDDLFELMIDLVARQCIRQPPTEIDPSAINWRNVVHEVVCKVLGLPNHEVFTSVPAEKPTSLEQDLPGGMA